MLLFRVNVLEPKLAFVSPYLTNHQEMATVRPGLPNTRQSFIYIYIYIYYMCIYYMCILYIYIYIYLSICLSVCLLSIYPSIYLNSCPTLQSLRQGASTHLGRSRSETSWRSKSRAWKQPLQEADSYRQVIKIKNIWKCKKSWHTEINGTFTEAGTNIPKPIAMDLAAAPRWRWST